ncbi:uncharacterized protein LOC116029603 [Ipomoea triloba]|uniref:uncharacterized protein LOC116029603 n=1 Tax=Ipomoea triloba TaxID=35885 RepID=UPI00125D469E|nr:uncharacterized protein LOC116029603 [Ipomoea triloba]
MKDPNTLVTHAFLFWESWKRAQQQQHVLPSLQPSSLTNPTHWSPPPVSYLKVNIDAAMDFVNDCMGFGWVVRDHEGRVQGVAMRKAAGLFSVPEAKAMGAQEALSWLKSKGWERVIIESDAQVVTRAVDTGDLNTPFGAIVRDVRSLLDQFESAAMCFVRRGSNSVAHALAKQALDQQTHVLVDFSEYMSFFISTLVCKDIMF